MKIDKSLILDDLDKHASEFNFPLLDNAYVAYAKGRLTAFANTENWAIAIEILGYSITQGIFSDDIYAYGSCLSREGVLTQFQVLDEVPENPLIDPTTDAWIADWRSWSISCKGKRYDFEPSHDDYERIAISVDREGGPGSLRQKDLLRYFVSTEGTPDLFLPIDQLRGELGCSGELKRLLHTEHWQHPNVALGELPSNSISFVSLLKALEMGSSQAFNQGEVNTGWQAWEDEINGLQ